MKQYISLVVSILAALVCAAQSSVAQFKVVGYIHPSKSIATDINRIDFSKLTHLNIAFVNPDSSGNLAIPFGFDTLITKAHDNKIKVLASIGGGSHNPYYAGLLNTINRSAFVSKLVNLVKDHDLDGLDVDLEGDVIDANYEPFVTELSAALQPGNKLLTAALATWNAEKISDVALGKFDYINVMSYDQTGPWRPDQPGPHSTFAQAEKDVNFWINERGNPKEKTNLGLPFYGYCFGTKYGESMTFDEIVKTFRGSDQSDSLMPEGGGVIHYNGLPTIIRKTNMALQKTGGVMIWELKQDSQDGTSLLNAIDRIIKSAKKVVL